jgi:hypothetical protein
MGYVTEDGARALLRYEYRGRDCSLIYRHILSPMNNVLIHWVPLWMAPNLVTVTGVGAALVAYAALAWFCPALTCDAMPAWLYILDAACTFIYQVPHQPLLDCLATNASPPPPVHCATAQLRSQRRRTLDVKPLPPPLPARASALRGSSNAPCRCRQHHARRITRARATGALPRTQRTAAP